MTTTINDQNLDAKNNTDAAESDPKDQQKTESLLTGEAKPEDVKPEDVKPEDVKLDGEKKPDNSDGDVPESYSDFATPEGMKLDSDMLDKFSTVAKELGLTQGKAQQVVDLASENMGKMLESQQKQISEMRDKWVGEIKTDKEYGGDNFIETITRAQRVLKNYGSEDLSTELKNGFGDNPAFIRMLVKIDKAFGEDKAVDGSSSTKAQTQAAVLFGDMAT